MDDKNEFDENVEEFQNAIVDNLENAKNHTHEVSYYDVSATTGDDALMDLEWDMNSMQDTRIDVDELMALRRDVENARDEMDTAADEAESMAESYRQAYNKLDYVSDNMDELFELLKNPPISVGDIVEHDDYGDAKFVVLAIYDKAIYGNYFWLSGLATPNREPITATSVTLVERGDAE